MIISNPSHAIEKRYVLSIVIPVYRGALNLPELIIRIEKAMSSAGLLNCFELILVNDASPDNSWQVINSLSEDYDFLRGINLRRNVGQHNAIMAGLHCVRGDTVVIMDDDLQHPPESIRDILCALDQGYDVCYTRYVNRQHSRWKQLGSHFNDWVASILLGKPKGLYFSSFKAMRREIANEIAQYDGPYTYVDGLILDVTRSITSVDIVHQQRLHGNSNYTLRGLFSLWLKMATSFSILPLRIATFVGFALTGLSVVLIFFIIGMKLTHPAIPRGWTSMIATMLFIAGVQTWCIGMIGEYLGRAYLKLNGKRQFVIGSTTWSAKSQNE
jgi:glycosyltransferase involved in cell wall biosynthesis